MSEILKKVDMLYRHIEEVQRNGRLLGERLIEKGHTELGLRLFQNILTHDASKFSGIEWDYLIHGFEKDDNKDNLQLAINHHNRTNKHHPESVGGIKNMESVFIAELVCDWKARSTEFGLSVKDWIDNGAMKRFGYSKRDKIYREIMYYTNLLLEEPFK